MIGKAGKNELIMDKTAQCTTQEPKPSNLSGASRFTSTLFGYNRINMFISSSEKNVIAERQALLATSNLDIYDI
jgi:hypothetical protein